VPRPPKTGNGDSTSSCAQSVIPRDYADWLASLKSHIPGARQRITLTVNQELVRLYHHIGAEILERQARQGWGAKVIDRLAADLRATFPEMKGFSSSNLKYMRSFAERRPTGLIGQQPADQLPWFHLVTLLTKDSGDSERGWMHGVENVRRAMMVLREVRPCGEVQLLGGRRELSQRHLAHHAITQHAHGMPPCRRETWRSP
jgi:hypothetical protein